MLEDIKPFWINKGSIKFQNGVYDCKTLNEKIELMNEYFLQRKYEKNQVIGICLDRCVELLTLIYALLQRGIPFLLLSGNTPEDRQDYMIRHIEISCIITEEKYIHKFSDFPVVFIEEIKKTKKVKRSQSEYYRAEEEDIAYYIYTSGSTGTPKAVEVTQKNLRNFVQALPEKIAFEKGGRLLNLSSVTFDLFMLESVFAMYQGLEIVLPVEEERADSAGLYKLLQKNKVDIIEITPSHLRILYAYDKQFTVLKGVKHILIGGERFPEHLLPDLQKNIGGKIYNMYGPAETTIWASVADLTKECEAHLGEPMKGYEFLIINKDGKQCREGETGELYILGEGVANGYKNDSLLTEKNFIRSKLDEAVQMYRTGDLVKYQNGKYFYLGRCDNQIKYGGYRIELEEIDECCRAIPEIENALTYFMEKEQYLIALYESKDNLTQEYLCSQLKTKLFDYMIPKCFKRVEKFFFNENGKLDRGKNYQIYLENNKKQIKVEKGSFVTEGKILEAIRKILPSINLEIKVGDTLQDIGIDSINFVKLVIELEETFGVAFDEEMLSIRRFERITDIADYIKIRSNG